jgi:O-antigen ligase
MAPSARLAALPAPLTIAGAWCVYLPLGLQYAAFLGSSMLAIYVLWRTGGLRRAAGHPVFAMASAFVVWMACTAMWSLASPSQSISHLWYYCLPLLASGVAATLRPADARTGLRHFVIVSAVAASVTVLWGADWLGGNQRIAYSLWLAIAAALALVEALRVATEARQRALWLMASLMCVAGLASQDRRTGMVVLPLLLVLLALLRQTSHVRRIALLVLVCVASLAVWRLSPSVQTRLDQGLTELRLYTSQGDEGTSMGMRLRMLELSAQMIAERPWTGHGLGSWPDLWRQRAHSNALLAQHTTPHNEYVLMAVQGGVVGLALFLALLGMLYAALRRRGRPADAALLVLAAFAVASLFNVALRDAKFALPLLMLGAMGWAAARPPPP